jgi:hypothetical protein
MMRHCKDDSGNPQRRHASKNALRYGVEVTAEHQLSMAIAEIVARVNHGTRRSCVRVPLSRRLLLALPDGCFIASNCCISTGESILKAELTDKNRGNFGTRLSRRTYRGGCSLSVSQKHPPEQTISMKRGTYK